ncbi:MULTISPECIES: HU family DNA-binding protein [Parabacteroides]|uniref:DNA-binding protein, histone-like, putative n=1 Tax=Parabacteroides chinchillae TaxID=871327 RepID=A0A8G2BX21_9BACT|nr:MULTISPECIES: DsbA family protein [Parabacteroides]SEF98367.1 DNA-binding protein, histone-like, putative [Parabacteroides chinchillae]
MSAQYKLVRNLTPDKENGKQPLHARFVPNGTMRLDDLVRNANGRSSLSSADIKGALQLLQDVIADALLFGYNIELEGIGTFGIALKCRPVMDKKEIRAESVHFRDVTFRSSSKLRDRLKAMPVVRSEEKEREMYTPEQCEAFTMEYLKTHPYISGKIYRSLCHCGKTKAAADLKRMMKEGKLRKESVGSTFLYSISDSF